MNGLVKNNPANDPDKKPVRARSNFKPNVSVYQTARFGECTPFYAAEAVPDDENFNIRVNSDVDTLTLKSPFMSALRMNKDYFYVPFRAICPHNADLIVTNPLTGDDVDPYAAPYIDYLHACFAAGGQDTYSDGTTPYGISVADDLKIYLDWDAAAMGGNPTDDDVVETIFDVFMWYRMSHYILSEGSLARNLGYNFHQLFHGPRKTVNDERLTYDEFYEILFDWVRNSFSSFRIQLASSVDQSGTPNLVVFNVFPSNETPMSELNNNISLRQLIFLLGQGYVPTMVDNLYYKGSLDATQVLPFSPWSGYAPSVFVDFHVGSYTSRRHNVPSRGTKNVSLSRLLAYQLSCAQFYTTDSVDFVYTTNLWHENQFSHARLACAGSWIGVYYYTLNGARVPYDSGSNNVIRSVVYDLPSGYTRSRGTGYYGLDLTASDSLRFVAKLFYLGNIFGFNRSLKYRDYFVGSKVRPMAVGNVDVTVTGGQFSVVDVTKNIMRQRFLNQVNRVGRTIKEYSRGIFGSTPMHDPTEVIFLGSTTDIIGAEETANTGADQRTNLESISSRLRTESSKFAFEGSFSEFGIVIGIMTFDAPRPYVNSLDHAITHVDRYDMFNPFMQTIGDQAVFGQELDANQELNFGYQLRYMEYRQRVDFCAGGFHKFLPGFAFLGDYRNIAQLGEYDVVISPDFIRSRSYEFDDLYVSLTHFTPAGYFHFIVRHDIDTSINRPMLAAPSIL